MKVSLLNGLIKTTPGIKFSSSADDQNGISIDTLDSPKKKNNSNSCMALPRISSLVLSILWILLFSQGLFTKQAEFTSSAISLRVPHKLIHCAVTLVSDPQLDNLLL